MDGDGEETCRRTPQGPELLRLRRSVVEEPSWREFATAYRAPFISSKHWDKNGQIDEAYSGALGAFSTPAENDSQRCFPTKQVDMGCRTLAQGGVLPTDHVQVSLVKGRAPLAVQTRQVENRPDFSMVSRAEVQRFGLVVPPPSVGRCNGGRDHDLGDGEDGCVSCTRPGVFRAIRTRTLPASSRNLNETGL